MSVNIPEVCAIIYCLKCVERWRCLKSRGGKCRETAMTQEERANWQEVKTVWASWWWSPSVGEHAGGCMLVCACLWQCECWVLAHHTLLWPKQIARRKKTHTEGPGGLTSAVPKHTTVCIHTKVACVPLFHHCEQHATIHTKLYEIWDLWKLAQTQTEDICSLGSFIKSFDYVCVFDAHRELRGMTLHFATHPRCFGPQPAPGKQQHIFSCSVQKSMSFTWRKIRTLQKTRTWSALSLS